MHKSSVSKPRSNEPKLSAGPEVILIISLRLAPTPAVGETKKSYYINYLLFTRSSSLLYMQKKIKILVKKARQLIYYSEDYNYRSIPYTVTAAAKDGARLSQNFFILRLYNTINVTFGLVLLTQSGKSSSHCFRNVKYSTVTSLRRSASHENNFSHK
jgi:hypothetical protein